MKKIVLSILFGSLLLSSCVDLDIPSKNKVSDDDLLSSASGMQVYLATVYSYLPIEDFKYMAKWGYEYNSWLGCFGIEGTGEAVNRDDICDSFTSERTTYWSPAFETIRKANHLIGTLPDYKSNYSEQQYNEFLGEGYFVRAFVFYQMARRFGGIPLTLNEIDYNPENPDAMEVPRSSEKDTWNQILADFDKAAELMPETATNSGYANKYVALAYKAEAMLYAGSVAKYNETVSGRLTGLGEKTGVRVIGFESGESAELSKKWFGEAYKAAREVMKSGKYSLYRKSVGTPEKLYQNMVDMWKDLSSSENIFVRQYIYPTVTHGLDAYSSPYYWHAPLAGGTCPTLDFVELFDGLPRYVNGQLKTTDGASYTEGHYEMYDSPYDLFANAEPRLRAYVILPMDYFRGREIEVRTGIYTGTAPVSPLFDDYSYSSASTSYANSTAYTGTPKTLYLGSQPSEARKDSVEIAPGVKMSAAGSAGPWTSYGEATVNGFHLRKYLDPDMELADIAEGKSSQPFILMRYADVLLAAAEAGVELAIAGASCPVEGDDMLQIASECIRDIRSRAGADELTSDLKADNDSRDIVRRERRKELAFEHKSKWDIRRWRVIHEEGRAGFWGEQRDPDLTGSGTTYRFRGLFPFYSTATGKYFFDTRFRYSIDKSFSYNIVDYYFEIPSGQVSKSKYIDQQPNR